MVFNKHEKRFIAQFFVINVCFLLINGFLNNYYYERFINTSVSIFIGGKRGMNKKTIIFGSVLAVFLMLMIPNVSAITYRTVIDETEQNLLNGLGNTDFNELKEKMKYRNIEGLRDSNISQILDILLWIFYILFYGFYTIENLVEGNYLVSLLAFFWFVISVFGLKQAVNNPEEV
jgi:hypothetical protein